jgi:2'-5' RNA ligase
MEKVVSSAVVVMPPESMWTQIQDIRAKHDKSYARWMPHINLLYPFLPEAQFKANLDKVQAAVGKIQPFTITFKKFDFFEHGRSCTLFMNPEVEPANALIDLQAALWKVFPICDDLSTRSEHGFHPHLTVGQFTGKLATERRRDEFGMRLKPIVFTVDQIHLIARGTSTPFEIKHSVKLGTSNEQEEEISEGITNPELLKEEDPSLLTDPVDLVIVRLKQWLCDLDPSKLPKTRDKLKTSIRPMCRLKQETPVSPIMKKLENEGYIQPLPNGEVRYTRKSESQTATSSQSSAQQSRGGNDYFSSIYGGGHGYQEKSPEDEAYERCQAWVMAPQNTPKTLDGLINSLTQLCIKKKAVEPEQVVCKLVTRGLISQGPNETIVYHL